MSGGDNWSGGTFTTSWASFTAANAVHSSQVNVLDNTSNNFYITGVQMELGDTASAFEYEGYGENLARCQRYYQTHLGNGASYLPSWGAASYGRFFGQWPVTMNHVPDLVFPATYVGAGTVDNFGGYYNSASASYFPSVTADCEL